MSNSELRAPKGTRDLFGREVQLFSHLEAISRKIFDSYGFNEVRTPIFESIDLFSRSLGSTSDVVEKEMFSFQDRGERRYALRPEGTAGVVRHYIEHNLFLQRSTQGLFYIGPMFRGERPQAGRYRQFWQIGSEYFGSSDPSSDADTVIMAAQIFKQMGLTHFSVQINSLGCGACRHAYREALLLYLQKRQDELSDESRRRMKLNPLRVLDSKIDAPKLVDAPAMKNYLCSECQSHHERFVGFLTKTDIPVEENPRLVRGLDYYVRSVFEFVSPDLGAQSALAAGGRYDGLVKALGGPAVPGVGFALGMDRVVEVASKKGLEINLNSTQDKSAVVIPLDEMAQNDAFNVAFQLRLSGIRVAPVHVRKKLKNQLGDASDLGIRWAILIGENELRSGGVSLKDLKDRTQETLSLNKAINKIMLC